MAKQKDDGWKALTTVLLLPQLVLPQLVLPQLVLPQFVVPLLVVPLVAIVAATAPKADELPPLTLDRLFASRSMSTEAALSKTLGQGLRGHCEAGFTVSGRRI